MAMVILEIGDDVIGFFEGAVKSELLAWIKSLSGEEGRENFQKLGFNRPKNKEGKKF